MFFECDEDGMYYTGHASCLIRISNKHILFDPVILSKPYGSNWVFYPPNDFKFDFSLLDAIVVSHIHQDHYDIKFLQKMSGIIPIFIFDGRQSFIEDLKNNGIKFTILKSFADISILDNVKIYGVLNRDNGVDCSCMIYNDNFKFYHGNDNFCSLNDLKEMVKITGDANLAAIPFAYINWYPQLVGSMSNEEKQAESDRLVQLYYQKFFDQASALGAKSVMPFGANLFPLQDAFSPSSMETKTPADLAEYVKSNPLNIPFQFLELYPSDYVIKQHGDLDVWQGHGFKCGKEFRSKFNTDLAQSFISTSIDQIPKKEASVEYKDINFKKLNSKMCRIPSEINEDFIIVSDVVEGAIGGLAYLSGYKEVSIIKNGEELLKRNGIPMHKLLVPQRILRKYLQGEISMENIIGTRSFIMFRDPESYRPDALKVINTIL